MSKKQSKGKAGSTSNQIERNLKQLKGEAAKHIATSTGQWEHQLWQEKMVMKSLRAGKMMGAHFDVEVPVYYDNRKDPVRLDFADFQTNTITDRKAMKPNQSVKNLVKQYQDQRNKHCQGYQNYAQQPAAQYIYSIYPSAVSGQITNIRKISIRFTSQGQEKVSAFDNKGQVIERFNINKGGKVSGHAKIQYGNQGKLVTRLSANGKPTGYILTKQLKDGGKLISRFDANKKPLGYLKILDKGNGTKAVSKFDAQGELTQQFELVNPMAREKAGKILPPPKPGTTKANSVKSVTTPPPKPGTPKAVSSPKPTKTPPPKPGTPTASSSKPTTAPPKPGQGMTTSPASQPAKGGPSAGASQPSMPITPKISGSFKD